MLLTVILFFQDWIKNTLNHSMLNKRPLSIRGLELMLGQNDVAGDARGTESMQHLLRVPIIVVYVWSPPLTTSSSDDESSHSEVSNLLLLSSSICEKHASHPSMCSSRLKLTFSNGWKEDEKKMKSGLCGTAGPWGTPGSVISNDPCQTPPIPKRSLTYPACLGGAVPGTAERELHNWE